MPATTPTQEESVMKIKSSRRLVKRLGLALAVAAFLVPNAQAMPLDMAAGSGDTERVRMYADDLRVAPPVRKYADDRVVSQVSEHKGYVPINEMAPGIPPSTEGSSSSTDWSSISIGIGTLFVVFGLGALLIVVRHSRSRGRLAAA
jgi:hypothetical protein